MEVAGVVLGAIPIIVTALEKYQAALEGGKDYWRYETTLNTIKAHVILQQEQLSLTLRNAGFQDLSMAEIDLRLRQKYPDKHDGFMTALTRMNEVLKSMMDKLKIDAVGKPTWTNTPSERAEWEWRRVKRAFSRSERERLKDELQYWNNALRACFERSEIASDEENPTVQKLLGRFDPKECAEVRENAKVMHEALQLSWKCRCHKPHRGSLHLEWHRQKVLAPSVFHLTVSALQCHTVDEHWKRLLVKLEKLPKPPQPTLISQAPPPASSGGTATAPQIPSTKVGSFFGIFSRYRSTKHSITQPPSSTPSTSPSQFQSHTPISDLCNCLQSCKNIDEYLGYLTIPRAASQRVQIHSTLVASQTTEMKPVRASLSASSLTAISRSKLSRIQRFEIAASAAWAVLFLSETPWLSEELDKDELYLVLNNSRTINPIITHCFYPLTQQPPTGSTTSTGASPDSQQIHATQIRNKTLFSLSIILIELCLNRPFSELRLEYNRGTSPVGSPPTALEDYQLAEQLTDDVYLEAGDLYGSAVQRCLRCEFPGRDVTKNFQFESFRRDFFKGVVAPIQATYDLMAGAYNMVSNNPQFL